MFEPQLLQEIRQVVQAWSESLAGPPDPPNRSQRLGAFLFRMARPLAGVFLAVILGPYYGARAAFRELRNYLEDQP